MFVVEPGLRQVTVSDVPRPRLSQVRGDSGKPARQLSSFDTKLLSVQEVTAED